MSAETEHPAGQGAPSASPGGSGSDAGWVGPYLRVRKLEGRLYPDALVAGLPTVPPDHPLAREWRLRAESARRLVRYIGDLREPARVVEIGCGNGWLSHVLSGVRGSEVVGMDANDVELEQARRVFGSTPNLRFVPGDVAVNPSPLEAPTVIVLASVIQYLPDLPAALGRLLEWLCPGGELHILDSPLYRQADVAEAAARSRRHYELLDVPEMAAFYHHHTWSELEPFAPKVLYRPGSLRSRVDRWIVGRPQPAFPWVKIARPE